MVGRRLRRAALAGGLLVLVAVAGLVLPRWLQHRRDAALVRAARVGDVAAMSAALDAGADPNARDRLGLTPLMHAARGENPDHAHPALTDRPEVVEILIRRGADPNARSPEGSTALFWAALFGHEQAARVLIAHGADVNARSDTGVTALGWAANKQHTRVVELLVAAGAR